LIMRILRTTLLGLLAFGLVGIQGSASAALINVVSAVASSEFGSRLAVHTIDGSGLTGSTGFGTGVHSNLPDGQSWLSQGTLGAGTDTLPATITFDLGASYSVDGLHVWNYNEAASGGVGRGADNVSISVATATGPFLAVQDTQFSVATGLNDYAGAAPVVDFDNVLFDDVRFVRFDINDAIVDVLNLAGLAEVQFSGTVNVIPEPSSLAMAGLGMFGIGGFGRRRRS